MDKIAVLIPCFNEAQTIEKVVRDTKANLPDATIYVYDNNSTDDTAKLAEAAGAVVRHEYMQGKGNVLRRMFRDIDAECYLMIDGDDTYPLEYAQKMCDLVLSRQTDMVVGDRLSSTYFTENKRPFHNAGNSFVRWAINHLFNTEIKDVMTGYRALSFDFVKTFPILSKGFEIETEMTIHAVYNNMHVENVVVDYRDRPEGSVSKLSTYSDGFKVIGTIFRLLRDYRPMTFFNSIALVLVALAVGFFIPIMVEFVQTGLVPKIPTLISCGFVLITAIISFFSGLILDSISQSERREFEQTLLNLHLNKN